MSVLNVNRSASHSFSKPSVSSITLIPNLGVEDDAHAGATVKHRSRLHINPAPPNLRQVHLIHSEILASASRGDVMILPGELGENITTTGIDLLALGRGTKLRFVSSGGGVGGVGGVVGNPGSGDHASDAAVAEVTVTGLRNPCPQIDRFRKGLKEKFIVRDGDGQIIGRRAGIMGIVEQGGEVRPGMRIVVEKPTVHEPLECV
ncbi:hypothetical protein ACJ72_06620 [Emergomyces africanus]|uniref:MOSC domain-containing protein n=1 Tax=Emergomyces africanus TaxID=1955775 RepID=A0A1B7NQF8_9EURO|nr:hypothetical protein ACJ72_06620 [Emergomyces africanus]